jgi:hypothetical protein
VLGRSKRQRLDGHRRMVAAAGDEVAAVDDEEVRASAASMPARFAATQAAPTPDSELTRKSRRDVSLIVPSNGCCWF